MLNDVLPGAQGLTLIDQDKIDETVARACAARLYTTERCRAHTAASHARRTALSTTQTTS